MYLLSQQTSLSSEESETNGCGQDQMLSKKAGKVHGPGGRGWGGVGGAACMGALEPLRGSKLAEGVEGSGEAARQMQHLR